MSLITFRSRVGDITVFDYIARDVLQLLGHDRPAVPGAIPGPEVDIAAGRLRAALRARDEDADPRLAPILDLFERAAAANVAILWQRAGERVI